MAYPCLPCPRILPAAVDDRMGGRGSSVACLPNVSGFRLGSGGGNGDVEMDVTLAECAWYIRKDCRRGKDITCFTKSVHGSVGRGVIHLRRFRCAFRLSRHAVRHLYRTGPQSDIPSYPLLQGKNLLHPRCDILIPSDS